MNSGVHDAWSLTDKLIASLKKSADPDAGLDLYDRQRRTVMHEFAQAQTIRLMAALQAGEEAQGDAQAQLAAVIDDDDQRRQHLLNQAMIASRQREAEIG